MPLPDGNVTWPPKQFTEYFDLLEVFDQWYRGDVHRRVATLVRATVWSTRSFILRSIASTYRLFVPIAG